MFDGGTAQCCFPSRRPFSTAQILTHLGLPAHPPALAYYATFVVVAVMVILNLFVGIITAEMGAAKNALIDRERDRKESRIEDQEVEILEHMHTLERNIESIRETLSKVKSSRAVTSKPAKVVT